MPAPKKRAIIRIANPVDNRRWTSVKRAAEYVRQGRARCLPDVSLEFVTTDYRHLSVVANSAGASTCRLRQRPTIDPIRHITPGEIIEWVKDLSGGHARYPIPGPDLFMHTSF